MTRWVLRVQIVASVLITAGCGTVRNMSENQAMYGGVRGDFQEASVCWNRWNDPSGYCLPPVLDLLRATYLVAVDMPLSAVADTLTLPWTTPSAELATGNTPPTNADPAGPWSTFVDKPPKPQAAPSSEQLQVRE